jgi:hypothetical protein
MAGFELAASCSQSECIRSLTTWHTGIKLREPSVGVRRRLPGTERIVTHLDTQLDTQLEG